MKIATFPTSALFDAIKAFVPATENVATILDTAHEIDGKIYFARVLRDSFTDESSTAAFSINVMNKRGEADQGVYLSPRRNSIFRGQLDDAVQLMKEGYNVYPIEEAEHNDVSIRLVSANPIKTHRDILTGSFREVHASNRNFENSFAFLAQPKSWADPTNEFIDEFNNWMNNCSYSYEVLSAMISDVNEDGDSEFIVEIISERRSYYSTARAESIASDALENCIRKIERTKANH